MRQFMVHKIIIEYSGEENNRILQLFLALLTYFAVG